MIFQLFRIDEEAPALGLSLVLCNLMKRRMFCYKGTTEKNWCWKMIFTFQLSLGFMINRVCVFVVPAVVAAAVVAVVVDSYRIGCFRRTFAPQAKLWFQLVSMSICVACKFQHTPYTFHISFSSAFAPCRGCKNQMPLACSSKTYKGDRTTCHKTCHVVTCGNSIQ